MSTEPKGTIMSQIRYKIQEFDTSDIETKTYPVVDYAKHPGFAHLYAERKDSSELIAAIAEIDEVISPLFNLAKAGRRGEMNDGLEKFNGLVDRLSHHPSLSDIQEPVIRSVREALSATQSKLRAEANFLLKLPSASTSISSDVASVLGALQRYGFSLFRLSKAALTDLDDVLRLDIDDLRRQSEITPNGRLFRKYAIGSPEHRVISTILSGSVVEAALHAYYGRKMCLDSIMLEYSHDASDWYKECYADVGVPTSPAAYFHVDHEYDRHKMSFLLADTQIEHGPFSYIPGSNTMDRSRFRFVYFKELDLTLMNNARDWSSERSYYRKCFGDPALRKEIAKIPAPLLGHSHFGDDLLDGSAETEWLLRNEFHVTGEAGEAVLFDGHNGIHRGGLVSKGERIVVHLGWGQYRSFAQKVAAKLRNFLPA